MINKKGGHFARLFCYYLRENVILSEAKNLAQSVILNEVKDLMSSFALLRTGFSRSSRPPSE
jgi:hypothetical protein